ncbi:MAG: hypothetical protein ACKPKO_63465, partial [Candidatus Fonsibacter sp.]
MPTSFFTIVEEEDTDSWPTEGLTAATVVTPAKVDEEDDDDLVSIEVDVVEEPQLPEPGIMPVSVTGQESGESET